jgi:hypothetical protein
MTFTYRVPIVLGLPVLFFGAGMLTAEMAPRAAELAAPEPVALIDAVAARHEEAIVRMILAGEDPGLSVVLKRPVFHWRRGETTSPLLVAIAGGDLNRVAYLARRTQRITDPPNDQALCVAARYGHSNIARFLMEMEVPALPKSGCGTLRRPEDVAEKYGARRLAKELWQYRLETR